VLPRWRRKQQIEKAKGGGDDGHEDLTVLPLRRRSIRGFKTRASASPSQGGCDPAALRAGLLEPAPSQHFEPAWGLARLPTPIRLGLRMQGLVFPSTGACSLVPEDRRVAAGRRLKRSRESEMEIPVQVRMRGRVLGLSAFT
jgi:hypothetical protein